jgi:hypothetical protein
MPCSVAKDLILSGLSDWDVTQNAMITCIPKADVTIYDWSTVLWCSDTDSTSSNYICHHYSRHPRNNLMWIDPRTWSCYTYTKTDVTMLSILLMLSVMIRTWQSDTFMFCQYLANLAEVDLSHSAMITSNTMSVSCWSSWFGPGTVLWIHQHWCQCGQSVHLSTVMWSPST